MNCAKTVNLVSTMNAAKTVLLVLAAICNNQCQMLIGHEEARWQNLMTIDDWFEDLAVQIRFWS